MERLKLNLHHCYGIKKLVHEFDFSNSRVKAIYAPNGSMKTSFAKTFRDLESGQDSKDLLYPTRACSRDITIEDGTLLSSDKVFVIESLKAGFYSDKMSTLLVNKELKTRYDTILSDINSKRDALQKVIKKTSGFKGGPEDFEKEVSLVFTSKEDEFYISIGRLESEINDGKEPEFGDIIYTQIFHDNKKVEDFLRQEDVKEKLQQYVNVYEQLISKSKYFKEGIFNHNNAAAIAKSLTDNGFFEADHSVYLHSDAGDSNIKTKEELEKVIEEEKQSILNNPVLQNAFDEIDKKLNSHADLRQFRDYVAKHPQILPELGGPRLNGFRQSLWRSYFKVHKDLYNALLEAYRSGQKELDEIGKKAAEETDAWTRVIRIFHKRFSVPFALKIENQRGVILKNEAPSIVFELEDSSEKATVGKSDILQTLSTGEIRALYILNIIFEIEARRNNNQETLLIIDDIADSFDYKNKYAIIEYLQDISDEPLFREIILTHNFDFFRTIERRFVGYSNCYTVEKSSSEIKLVDAEYIHNPFEIWMKNLATNDVQLLASIPFVRNIIEYTKGKAEPNYLKLTSLLHYKTDTDSITKKDLEEIYNAVFPNLGLTLTDPTKKVLDLMMETTKTCLASTEVVRLENKIVLAMAIRLKAERYVFSKITDKSEPSSNQTIKIIKRYESEFSSTPGETEKIEILRRVNLMTPENIHLNSFMYEPILDMSDEGLKNLCKEVDSLI